MKIEYTPVINSTTKVFPETESHTIYTDGPMIEYAPVKHGKWIVAGNTTHYYICSICGKPGDGFDNYCRSCGAKMDNEMAGDAE